MFNYGKLISHLGRIFQYYMRFFLSILFSTLLSVLFCGCGNDSSFRLNGEIDGFGTGNLRVVYFDKGAVQNVTAIAVDGKFAVDARVSGPVMARLYTGSGRMLAAFNAQPGDNLEGKFFTREGSVFTLSGNDDANRVAEFLKANQDALASGNHASLNASIADYVSNNKNRRAAGTLLASYFYLPGNEAKAIELIALLNKDVAKTSSLQGLADFVSPMAVPSDSLLFESFSVADRKGKLLEIDPANASRTILLFSDSDSRMSDSITDILEELAKTNRPTLQIFDISTDTDTASWQQSLRDISATDSLKSTDKKVLHGWAPNPYSIMGMETIPVGASPWFVVADSTRRVLYRGPKASEAKKIILK